MEGITTEVTVGGTPALAVKKDVPYEKKIAKMSNRQLVGELRRQTRNDGRPGLNSAFATVLDIVMENHSKGMNPYINRTTKFTPFVIKK